MNTELRVHTHTKCQHAHVHARGKKLGCHLSGCRREPWTGEICPVMAVNEGCGGAVTLCLAGTQELRGVERGGGHGHCVQI